MEQRQVVVGNRNDRTVVGPLVFVPYSEAYVQPVRNRIPTRDHVLCAGCGNPMTMRILTDEEVRCGECDD